MELTNPLEAILKEERLFENESYPDRSTFRQPGQPQPRASAEIGANAALNNLMRLGYFDDWFENTFLNHKEFIQAIEKHMPTIMKNIEVAKKL